MLNYHEIEDLHLEISSLCNARCPMCMRNLFGYPHNLGYPEVAMSLAQFQKIFPQDFLQRLKTIDICGNYGDFVTNPESLDIINYILKINPEIGICISTNGSARNQQFWAALGRSTVKIIFCIDGLGDVHEKYRIDTKWDTVIKNASDFIAAGGNAVWKMIEFDHNRHQIEDCKQMAFDLGFQNFMLSNHGRITGHVYSRQGVQVDSIGSPEYKGTKEIEPMIMSFKKKRDVVLPKEKSIADIDCYSLKKKSIYVAANGEVYPCCFMGFYPTTYRRDPEFNFKNSQISKMIGEMGNQSLEVGLESAINWFSQIEESWKIDTYTSGRSYACDHHCGQKKYQDCFAK